MLKEIKLNLKGIEYKVKASFRSMLEFETMTGKSVDSIKGLNSMSEFLYCSLKSNNRNYPKFEMTYDEFLDSIDEQIDVITKVSGLFDSEENTEEEKNV
jgi:hypothetical protein